MISTATLSAAAGIASLTHFAQAVTYTHTNTSGALNNSALWTPAGGPPTSSDIGLFNNVVTGAQTESDGASYTIGELQVLNPGGAITITDATFGLTLQGINGVGIDMSAATQNLTINPALTLGSTQSWTVASGRTLAVGGSISGGSNGVTLNGPGTFTLTGAADTYTGPTTVNGAQLNVTFNAASNNLNSSSSMVINGGAVNFGNNITNTTNTQALTSLTIDTGAGTLTQGRISGGKVIVNLGALTRGAGSLGVGGSLILFPTSNSSLFSTTTANTNGIIGGWAIYNGTDFAKANGNGVAIGAPTYTNNTWGTTTNTAVTSSYTVPATSTTNSLLLFQQANQTVTLAGTGIITSGGLLVTTNFTSAFNDVITGGTLEGAAGADLILNQYGAGAIAINSVIADNTSATALTKSGAGLLKLGGSNTFTGGIYMNAGGVQLTTGASLNGNPVTFTNNSTASLSLGGINATIGALNTSSIVNATGPIVQNANTSAATLTINSTATGTYAGAIQDGTGGGSLGLAVTGGGVQNLTGVLSYTGPTSVSSGTLFIKNNINSSKAISVGSSGTLDVTTSGLAVGGGNTLSGSGTVLGSVSLPASANLTPGTLGTIGTLSIGSLSLATGSNFNLDLSGTSGVSDLITVTNALTLGTSINVNLAGTGATTSGNTYTLFNFGSQSGFNSSTSFTIASGGAGGLTYTFANTGNAITLAIGGALAANSTWALSTGGSWASPSSNWTPNTVPNNAGDTANFGNTIGSASTVTLDGSHSVGVLNFNSPNVYTIAAGTGGNLIFDNGASLANLNDSSTPANPAAPGQVITANVTLNSNTSVAVASGETLAITGTVGGTGGLTTTGTGVVNLGASNSYSGATTLNAGTLNAVSGALSSGTIVFGGGALQYASGNTDDISANGRTVTFAAPATIDTNGNNVIYTSPIGNGGAGGLVKVGAGTLTVANGNTFTGASTISGGTLRILGDTSLGAVPGSAMTDLTINNATLQFGAATALNANRNITLLGTTDYIDTNGNAVTIGGQLSGSGTLRNTGAGTLTLTGSNSATATGGFIVDGGTVYAASVANLPSGTLVLNNGSTVSYNSATTPPTMFINGTAASIDTAPSGNIFGTGAVYGSGTLTISGNYVNDLTGDLTGYTGYLSLTGNGFRFNGSAGGG